MNTEDQTISPPLDSTDSPAEGAQQLVHSKDPKFELMGFALQSALEEIMSYKELIDSAKTQAKKDLYLRKIKKTTKRLKRILPTI